MAVDWIRDSEFSSRVHNNTIAFGAYQCDLQITNTRRLSLSVRSIALCGCEMAQGGSVEVLLFIYQGLRNGFIDNYYVYDKK